MLMLKRSMGIVRGKNDKLDAIRIGINPTLLRNYINGFKKPSKEREQYTALAY